MTRLYSSSGDGSVYALDTLWCWVVRALDSMGGLQDQVTNIVTTKTVSRNLELATA